MAKGRGLVRHAIKAVKQQKKAKNNNSKSTFASKPSATRPGSGPPAAKKQKTNNKAKNAPQQRNQQPTIPFSPSDPILLVGEGDLSFAASLITHHGCTNVTATVLEPNFTELSAKYPHVSANTAVIESPRRPNCRLLYGIDARKLPPFTTRRNNNKSSGNEPPVGAMKRIIFNFPHTGGKSKDVNRQVRHNQELLVDFFRRAQHSLAPGGAVVVTLFEGEPYTLWNVRDLARHAGLQVERSFRFAPTAYPGYAHARTLGVVRNRRGEVATAAWKGEDRPARSYVFVRKGESSEEVVGAGMRKRKRGMGAGGESSSDEDDEGDEEQEEHNEGDGWEVDEEGGDDEVEEEEDGEEENVERENVEKDNLEEEDEVEEHSEKEDGKEEENRQDDCEGEGNMRSEAQPSAGQVLTDGD
ncbi:hypothetical protein C7999DRAFT_12287 [Corynascus novoguineensis]|uniref:25S rRNA (uridine-N(3))-methyltransferase BMT5-like domain-containing protein n=1 Tax=Corynascus novoguineensis TaxID=1126955 RepID=A0AAN7CXQ1_9PEZI|nr:hypothetical protein C7999DRAFT_12287 [Corynascus novoguineensis]